MYISCKCLNVAIEGESGALGVIELGKLGLTSVEQRDPFFNEKLGSIYTSHINCNDASLMNVRRVGAWLIHQCLVCQSLTHAALSSQPHQLLVNLKLCTTKDEVERLRLSDNYSPVFKILVNNLMGKRGSDQKTFLNHSVSGHLNRKLARALQTEVDAVEEAVRLFKERKYTEFEAFRERAHRDHKMLSSIFNGADNSIGDISSTNNANAMFLTRDKTTMASQLTNQMGQATNTIVFPNMAVPTEETLRNDNKSLKSKQSPPNTDCYKEDSLDSEGIFDLEGTDPPLNGLSSDVYDSDSDDSVSRDEGIHISRDMAQPWNSSIAKSLPVNVPTFAQFHDAISQEKLDQRVDEPQDIAASIKALARSVHGDVFGDLPRPRFSTQI